MKRFWDLAAVASTPTGFQVLLDGKPVRLPGCAPLTVRPHRDEAGLLKDLQVARDA